MTDMWARAFLLDELMIIAGVVHSASILVHLLLRARFYRRAVAAILFFTMLCIAFALDYTAFHLSELLPVLGDVQQAAWFMVIPLSVLALYPVLLLDGAGWGQRVLLIGMVGGAIALSFSFFSACGTECTDRAQAIKVAGLLAGSCAVLTIWGARDAIGSIYASVQIQGRERYWLVICILGLCCGILILAASSLSALISEQNHDRIRTILGLTFIYVAGTSFFRLGYDTLTMRPVGGHTQDTAGNEKDTPPIVRLLDVQDQAILNRLADLLALQKVYQEPNYGRTDLARELGVSEAVLSRLVNLSYGQSVPQLLNTHRVEDAKRLLRETDAPIKTVAAEAGFNSIPTFNRVFRSMTGATPSTYREHTS